VPAATIRTRRRRITARDGFTLVEVACAAFVLLFAITSSVVAMQAGFRSLDYARGLTLASQVLQSEIENTRMLPVSEIKNLFLAGDEVFDLSASETYRLNGTLTRRITEIATTPALYEIEFLIRWRTTDQLWHSRSTSTRYCANGLNDYFATDPRRSP
jgi:Tfp pilus assembly protein PilV